MSAPLLFHEVLAQELKHQHESELEDRTKTAYAKFRTYEKKVEEKKAEFSDIKDELERAKQINQAVLPFLYDTIHALENPRTALSLSGGGIRSATFGLGIIQSLAHWGLLEKFDYLSTVSGGGYIGGWLSAWIHRIEEENKKKETTKREVVKKDDENEIQEEEEVPIQPDKSEFQGVIEVQKELANPSNGKLLPEPEQITHLRSYSNYMTPKLGLLSADTWTLVAVYFRNLSLNWLVLVPLFAAFLLIPRILFTATYWVAEPPGEDVQGILKTVFGYSPTHQQFINTIGSLLLVAGIVLCCIAVTYIIACRPSLNHKKDKNKEVSRIGMRWKSQKYVLIFGIFFLTAWAYMSSNYWAWFVFFKNNQWTYTFFDIPFYHPLIAFIVFSLVLNLAGFLFYRIFLHRTFNPKTFAIEFLISVLNGLIGGLMIWLVATNIFENPILLTHSIEGKLITDIDSAVLYSCMAVPSLLLLFIFSMTLFVGLASKITEDMDREWLARFAGWVLIVALVWFLAHLIVLYGPVGLSELWEKRGWIWKTIITAIGGVSALITLLGGYVSQYLNKDSQKDSPGKFSWIVDLAPKFAAPVFALFLLVLLAFGTSLILRLGSNELSCGKSAGAKYLTLALNLSVNGQENKIQNFGELCKKPTYKIDPDSVLNILPNTRNSYLVVTLGLFLLVGGIMGLFVNVNKFSLHAAYRDRLIRAYLGASNLQREPNLFTGFDENDNLQMRDLKQKKPLHVINQTLNLVSGKNLAWQQRKATSFTVSHLHCGNFMLGYRSSEDYAKSKGLNLLNGEREKRAITLGTATAISGAAASPNMGYYSSSIVTFLMALFNVRLGWWLGNPGPAGDKTFDKSGPTFAPRPLIEETLGLTDEENPYIYLSDGGHFENLGIYEMVRRRCHLIVVSDAACDTKFEYNDLSNAVEKVRVDLGVPINISFDNIPIYPPNAKDIQKDRASYCAIARISYTKVDGDDARDGLLIYIKPTLYGKEPIDVIHYSKENPEFPQQSTADQFYSETQFESYRTLGFYIGHRVFANESKRKNEKEWNNLSEQQRDQLTPENRAKLKGFGLEEVIEKLKELGTNNSKPIGKFLNEMKDKLGKPEIEKKKLPPIFEDPDGFV